MNKADEKVMISIKRREPLDEPFIKLSLILKTGGVEADGYLGMCGDRVADALLIDGEDVRIDFMNFPDMELTAAGVSMCREILESYVSGDIIADALEALVEEKAERKHINIISQTLREMKLYGLSKALIKSDAKIRRFVIAEIFQRLPLLGIFRKMRSAYYSMLVRVKYHRLISIVGRIVAEKAQQI